MALWKINYDVNSNKYYPLQDGTMSATLTNTSENRMLVTQVGVSFGWLEDLWYSTDCCMEIAPGATKRLPKVNFSIDLDAPAGTHLYKPGIVFKLRSETGWEEKGLSYVRLGKHLIVTKAPRRNFEVFVSHSNSTEDAKLLESVIDAFDRCGIGTYVAERSPEPGYPLWQKIEAAIRRADAILVLWTKEGAQSGDIREELGIAVGTRKTKRIIPLVQGGESTKGSLIGIEHIPLELEQPIKALSDAISRAIEWADKKEQGKPRKTST